MKNSQAYSSKSINAYAQDHEEAEDVHDSFSDIDESMDRYKKRSMIKTKQSL